MRPIPNKFTQDSILENKTYNYFTLANTKEYRVEGNNRVIDAKENAAHILHIDNSNAVINNLVFKGGNTALIKTLTRSEIIFSRQKQSIFELLDGGAVLITGKSKVIFNKCTFQDNHSILCGGAISNQSIGTVTFNDCQFTNNTAGHTGAVIDNLVPGSNLIINNSRFSNNVSNKWNNNGAPHGHISLFSGTSAQIRESVFRGGSVPFDLQEGARVELTQNIYSKYEGWSESGLSKRDGNILNPIKMFKKLYWLPLKTIGKVHYRISKP